MVHEVVVPWESETIPDDDFLYMRVHVSFGHELIKAGIVPPGVFNNSKPF